MRAISIEPGKAARKPPCGWCGLRFSVEKFQGTDCCQECKDGGRVFRVKMACQRWKRLAQPKVVNDE